MNIFSRSIKVITHSGGFHSDEVFAVATLEIAFNVKAKIKRERIVDNYNWADFIIDVGARYDGEKFFDHHQGDFNEKRVSGIPYASFGLIWKRFGERVCGNKDIAEILDKGIVSYIDAMDNGIGDLKEIVPGVYPYTLGNAIFAFDTGINKDQNFRLAVDFAKGILKRQIELSREEYLGKEKVLDIYEKTEDKRLIILNEDLPWEFALSEKPEPLFIVLPGDQSKGQWKLRTVRSNPRNFINRKDLPAEWAGKRGGELENITGVPGAEFCHNKRFIVVAKTKDSAIELARKALAS